MINPFCIFLIQSLYLFLINPYNIAIDLRSSTCLCPFQHNNTKPTDVTDLPSKVTFTFDSLLALYRKGLSRDRFHPHYE